MRILLYTVQYFNIIFEETFFLYVSPATRHFPTIVTNVASYFWLRGSGKELDSSAGFSILQSGKFRSCQVKYTKNCFNKSLLFFPIHKIDPMATDVGTFLTFFSLVQQSKLAEPFANETRRTNFRTFHTNFYIKLISDICNTGSNEVSLNESKKN